MQTYHLAGIDLAWIGAKNPTAAVSGILDSFDLGISNVYENMMGAKSVIDTLDSLNDLHGVAIDAPLIVRNTSGQRPCENQIGRAYGARKASCHTTNLNIYPSPDGVRIAKHLTSVGFGHLAGPGQKWQLECYPHPALIEWFGLAERHLYKKGDVQDRRNGQINLANMLLSLAQSPVLKLHIPKDNLLYFDPTHIESLGGARLKHNEDVLDAVVCLYTAGLYQIGQREHVFGNTEEGYIYVPQCLCI